MTRARGVHLCVAVVTTLSVGPARADRAAPRDTLVERDRVDVAPAAGVTIDRVTIDNRFGDVSVRGRDGPGVSIVAIKRAPDAATMDRLRVSLVPDPAGPVVVRTTLVAGVEARPVPAGTIRVDLVVYTPRTAHAAVMVWNGAVSLASLDNGAEVTTNEGAVDVRSCSGAIETHVAQGPQRFSEVFGALEAEGLTGEMSFHVVRGERLGAMLHRGSIVADEVRARTVELRTTTGDIGFTGEAVPGGIVRIAAHHGDVRMTLRGDAAVQLVAVSRVGEVVARGLDTTRTATRVVGTYGGGGDPAGVFLMTHVGDVDFALKVGLAR